MKGTSPRTTKKKRPMSAFWFLVDGSDAPPARPPARGRPPARLRSAPPDALEIPRGLSYLGLTGKGRVVIRARSPKRTKLMAELEVIKVRGQEFLLMASRPESRARVNGHAVPRLAAPRLRDQLQFGTGPVMHLTVYNRPVLAPPAPEFIGKECHVCRVPFTEGTKVFTCSFCRTPLHCEGEEKDRDERLECARLRSECPFCHEPLRRTEGYLYVPEP